jgi:hypothetical protein
VPGTVNEARALAGMPSVPSESFTRGIFCSYIASMMTRVVTPSRRAASAGRSTSGSVIATNLRVFIDLDLLQYDEVWAAAGTWNDVFGIEPHELVEASGGVVTDLKR